MLKSNPLTAAIPASDFERAKAWYADTFGLRPVEDLGAEGAWYESGGCRFFLYPSEFAGTNQATAAAFRVDDFDAAVKELRAAGVTFEVFDYPGIDMEDGVMTMPSGARGVWFKDSEGNILAVTDG